jgi:hypothetical protein
MTRLGRTHSAELAGQPRWRRGPQRPQSGPPAANTGGEGRRKSAHAQELANCGCIGVAHELKRVVRVQGGQAPADIYPRFAAGRTDRFFLGRRLKMPMSMAACMNRMVTERTLFSRSAT